MDADFLMLMLIFEERKKARKKKARKEVHSRYRKDYYNSLDSVRRRLGDKRIPRVALHDTNSSAWMQVYNSGNDQALITLTGFDFATFRFLEKYSHRYMTSTLPGFVVMVQS